jgi:[glutamine synthetase] adenylyltransferase / [glutamine synthetase]-adenylyl-L-tyrosine phosphorylase
VIYDVPPDAMTGSLLSDGARPLSAPQYYTRLTQRLVAALSVPTTEGTLYEVDLRLRPSGQKGPLATSLEGFAAYQSSEAWAWEHMALTRARVVSAQPALKTKIETAISSVLATVRDPISLAAEVREMRTLIASEKGSTDPWDLKQVRGGLVDLEFVTQYLQLAHACQTPSVLDTNTRRALTKLAAAGHLAAPDAAILVQASSLLTNLTGLLRLLADGPFSASAAPRGLKDRLARAGAEPTFSALEEKLKETEAAVYQAFERVLPLAATETRDLPR